MPLTRDEDIAELLRSTRTIALIGASDRPDRPSWGVMKFLVDHGYRVMRFWNNDVLENIEGVITTVASHLPSPPVGEGGAQRRMRGRGE